VVAARNDFRIVLDTNALLRALADPVSPAGKLLHLVESRLVMLLLSKPVLREYRAVLNELSIRVRHAAVTPAIVEAQLKRLLYFGEYYPAPRARFCYPRDPRDEPFIELAIAGGATHLISYDLDLLSLVQSASEAARRLRRRLPRLVIVRPDQFLRAHNLDR
jgi:putative PIN family toxin of toxin-antitoxin system